MADDPNLNPQDDLPLDKDDPKSGNEVLDLTNPAIRAAVDELIAEANSAVEANKNEIIGEKREMKRELDDLKAKLEAYGEETPDTISALKSRLAAVETDDDKKADAEEIARLLTEEKERVSGPLNEKIEKLEADLAKEIAEGDATFLEGQINAAMVGQIMEGHEAFIAYEARQRGQVVRDDEGQRKLEVLKMDGKVLYTDKGEGDFADILKEMKAGKHAGSFIGNQKKGAGFKGSKVPAGDSNPWASETFNFTKQLQLESSNPALAQQLKAAAVEAEAA